MHRWWVCLRWDALRGLGVRNLARLGAKTDWQPRCLWECGFLLSPDPGDCPPAPPSEAEYVLVSWLSRNKCTWS